jgi:hypothetical protein
MTKDPNLMIYLNDHLGGSTFGRERCRRARDRNQGGELGVFLDWLLLQIVEDRETLVRIIDAVGGSPSRVKPVLGYLAEKAARLKGNGQLIGYTSLARFVELELLSLGVEGKRLLWVVLRELGDPRLTQFDFVALEERARNQREGLESHRTAAAAIALR